MPPRTISPPSIPTANSRRNGTPRANRIRPDEYRFITAPATHDRITLIVNGTRNHVGSKVASAPNGSFATAPANRGSPAANRIPDSISTKGVRTPANVVHPKTPLRDDVTGR